MKIYKFLTYLFVASLSIPFVGCTDRYEDYNRDRQGATEDEVSRDDYNVRAYFQTMQDFVIPYSQDQTQFTECLLGGSFGGYLADSNAGFNGRNYATYIPEEHWIQVIFKDVYPKIMTNYSFIEEISSNQSIVNAAKIIKVMGALRVTDVYGPIPYSQMGKGGQIKAPYDSVEDIYLKMIEELNEAIDYLTEHQTDNFSPIADLVYKGNVVKWVKLANTLKLRMAMRLTNVRPELAKTYAEEVANHSIGTMSSNDDNASKPVLQTNPFYVVVYEYNDGDSRISADILSFMNGYVDPRREAYFTDAKELVGEGRYSGLRSGIDIPDVPEIKLYSNMKITTTSNLVWMNASEAAFLKAEGALRGWNMGGTAEEFYNEGVRLSFGQYGVGGADTYLSDANRAPEAYVDPLGLNSYSGAVSSITVKWDNTADLETNLERIITQKWIANFPLGIEAWSEYRRTGYPKLMPVKVNKSGGSVNTERMARRLPYPQIEYSGNTENLQEAISKYLKGPDNMGTDLWWAKKN